MLEIVAIILGTLAANVVILLAMRRSILEGEE